MKKFAIKGLVALAVVVALCMFFSGTIKTISTAKVKLVTAKSGKLEEEIKLKGTLVFPETEDILLPGLDGERTVTVKRVRVAKGRLVEKGDVLFEAEVAGYDSAMKSLQKECDDAQKQLLDLERKNGDLRLKRTEEIWIEAYDALADARAAQLSARTALEVAARMAGVTLEGGELPAGEKDKDLLAAQEAVDAAKEQVESAQERFSSANRLGISEDVVTYVTTSRELREKLEKAQADIAELTVLGETAKSVLAPHDGYIVEINVKAGDTLGAKTVAIVMSAEKSKGVMRADTSELTRKIDKGTQVAMSREGGKTVTKKTTDSGTSEEGKPYVDVEVSDKDIKNLGGAASLMATAIDMVASYRAESSTTLLPVSAVRGTGESRYVYVVSEERNALGEQTLKVSKMDVHVLAEVGSTASIQEELGRQRVAYMEDRAISEGSEVMVYAQ